MIYFVLVTFANYNREIFASYDEVTLCMYIFTEYDIANIKSIEPLDYLGMTDYCKEYLPKPIFIADENK